MIYQNSAVMETPKNTRQRVARNPTPRLSERKKSLFFKLEEMLPANDYLYGIAPLDIENNFVIQNESSIERDSKVIKALLKGINSPKRFSFLKHETDENYAVTVKRKISPTRRSFRISLKAKNFTSHSLNKKKSKTQMENCGEVTEKEDVPKVVERELSDEQLQLLFTNSMNLNNQSKTLEADNQTENVVEGEPMLRSTIKRSYCVSSSLPSPQSKLAKLDSKLLYAKGISPKCFYSNIKSSLKCKDNSVKKLKPPISPKTKRYQCRQQSFINKGVHHKIRRKFKPICKLTSSIETESNATKIINSLKNEKLRNLLLSKRQEKEQIEKVHNVFRNGLNPIEMAKPLSILNCTEIEANITRNSYNNYVVNEKVITPAFSDVDSDSEFENRNNIEPKDAESKRFSFDEVIAYNITDESQSTAHRKFFKSGHSTSTRKEFQITNKIKASVNKGKITIVPEKKRQNAKFKRRNTVEFSMEQAKVVEILKNFDNFEATSMVDDPTAKKLTYEEPHVNNELNAELIRLNTLNDEEMLDEIQLQNDTEFSVFRRRLPYNTSNPEIIEQQHLLLDFLITNKICTEENFTIFIADPDNHKAEASRIIDQVIVVVNEHDSFRQRLPYNTSDPRKSEQQRNFLEFLIENDICTEENFNIFIVDYEQRKEEAVFIITNAMAKVHNISVDTLSEELEGFTQQNSIDQSTVKEFSAESAQSEKLFPIFYSGKCQPITQSSSRKRKGWTGGQGQDQYQIDAGQRNFGAHQCKQCGLVYTVHEPEEERLHEEYHASIHVLRFKGWIDEDIVSVYPEWGVDGRILRLTDSAHLKRKERLLDILQIVNKELGYSSYNLPKIFVSYFAVRKCQIVGLCLVIPLDKAHKYISLNGIDCCTDETFDARCGVSRIWVSPLHRRFRIATKLIKAVQIYTIFGEEIPMQKIAFSVPTEDGKLFAKKVTKLDNFLIYQ